VSGGALLAAATGLGLSLLVTACGAATQRATTVTQAQAGHLPGWTALADPPGISQLSPGLGGLRVLGQADARALVRDGDAIRTTTITFATAKDASEAQKRGAGDDYQGQLERAFRGETIGRGPGVGVKLRVPRPTGSGSDVVEVYLLARGRRLALVELVSARGFDPALRGRVLRLLSRRTAAG